MKKRTNACFIKIGEWVNIKKRKSIIQIVSIWSVYFRWQRMVLGVLVLVVKTLGNNGFLTVFWDNFDFKYFSKLLVFTYSYTAHSWVKIIIIKEKTFILHYYWIACVQQIICRSRLRTLLVIFQFLNWEKLPLTTPISKVKQ